MISFTPNCTLPTTTPSGFINGANIRSTMDIVWGCASVIVLSTWSVLHLNVPPDLKTRSRLQRIRKEIYLLERKLGWMGIMLAFPEYLTGISIANLFSAWVNNPQLEELAQADGVPWSLTHTVLANIGGIAIRFSEPSRRAVSGQQDHQQAGSGLFRSYTAPPGIPKTEGPRYMNRWSTTPLGRETGLGTVSSTQGSTNASTSKRPLECNEIPVFIRSFQEGQERALRGLGQPPWAPFGPHMALAAHAQPMTEWVQQNKRKYNAEQIAPLHGNIWILDSKQLVLARKSNVINKLPVIQEEEINDKSKIDGLLRIVALTQVLWFAAQLITRRIELIPSSALEISTVAFASCAIIIYITEWPKPKDVGVPFYVDTDAAVSRSTFELIAEAAPITFLQARRYYIAQSSVHQVIEGRYRKAHVDRLVVLTSILSISLYGGIHLFAWNLDFPTGVERLLWRIAALTVGIAPTVSALLVLMEDLISHRTDRWSKWSVTVLAPAYVAARLYIIAESFRSLYYMPVKAFVATRTVNFPHIG